MNPAVSNAVAGQWFDVVFKNFNYRLNGASVALNVANIRFFSNANSGFFNVCFNSPCGGLDPIDGFGLFNSFMSNSGQLYSGSESAPTMLTGVYTPAMIVLGVGNSGPGFENLFTIQDLSIPPQFRPDPSAVLIAAVPEPSTLLLVGVVVLALILRSRVTSFG
jgi:hypothetical protein